MNISFAVLHYERTDITTRCVDSLLRLRVPSECQMDIIVVDNKSPNNSYADLLERYGSHHAVTLIQSERNDGFAEGNNIAFRYMKRHLNTEIGVFLNNDTEITDIDFLEKLTAIYREKPFDVLAIDVYDPHADQHQSPLCLGSDLFSYAREESASVSKFLSMPLRKRMIQDAKAAISQILYPIPAFRAAVEKRVQGYSKSVPWQSALDDVVVQGSCVIYGSSFFEAMDYAFYPETRMYFEECILKVLCDKKGLTTIYTPALSILHHHHECTRKYLKSNSVTSLQNRARLELESYEVLAKLTDELASRQLGSSSASQETR